MAAMPCIIKNRSKVSERGLRWYSPIRVHWRHSPQTLLSCSLRFFLYLLPFLKTDSSRTLDHKIGRAFSRDGKRHSNACSCSRLPEREHEGLRSHHPSRRDSFTGFSIVMMRSTTMLCYDMLRLAIRFICGLNLRHPCMTLLVVSQPFTGRNEASVLLGQAYNLKCVQQSFKGRTVLHKSHCDVRLC